MPGSSTQEQTSAGNTSSAQSSTGSRQEGGAAAANALPFMAVERNLILILTSLGVVTGFGIAYMLKFDSQTGFALLTCVSLGLLPTLFNMHSALTALDFGRLPLNSVFVLGCCTGYLMANRTIC